MRASIYIYSSGYHSCYKTIMKIVMSETLLENLRCKLRVNKWLEIRKCREKCKKILCKSKEWGFERHVRTSSEWSPDGCHREQYFALWCGRLDGHEDHPDNLGYKSPHPLPVSTSWGREVPGGCIQTLK